MQVVTLDPRATHVNNPNCPMRLALMPDGKTWYCVDCGFAILHKRLEVEEEHERTDQRAKPGG
jgi:hypothetical protein